MLRITYQDGTEVVINPDPSFYLPSEGYVNGVLQTLSVEQKFEMLSFDMMLSRVIHPAKVSPPYLLQIVKGRTVLEKKINKFAPYLKIPVPKRGEKDYVDERDIKKACKKEFKQKFGKNPKQEKSILTF